MNKHDKNFLKNMSPFLIAAVVMFFMAVAFETKADDHMYTEHGIKITEEDLRVKSIRVNSIRSYSSVNSNTIRVTTNRREQFDIELYTCFDISFAHRLVFQPWGGFSSIGKGDKIIPISFGRASRFPCTIKSITAVLTEKKDEEEN